MLPAPSFVLDVCTPIIAPILARRGDLLVVWPGHPTHTLAVTDPSGSVVRRFCYVSDGALYGQIMALDDGGAVRFRRPADRARLLSA